MRNSELFFHFALYPRLPNIYWILFHLNYTFLNDSVNTIGIINHQVLEFAGYYPKLSFCLHIPSMFILCRLKSCFVYKESAQFTFLGSKLIAHVLFSFLCELRLILYNVNENLCCWLGDSFISSCR